MSTPQGMQQAFDEQDDDSTLTVDEFSEQEDKSKVDITMSLTTPGCSMGQHMADDIKSKVSKLDQVESVEVAITFDPPWKPDMMTEDARSKLGFESINKTNNSQKIETEWD